MGRHSRAVSSEFHYGRACDERANVTPSLIATCDRWEGHYGPHAAAMFGVFYSWSNGERPRALPVRITTYARLRREGRARRAGSVER
jgi:hypothetical protein